MRKGYALFLTLLLVPTIAMPIKAQGRTPLLSKIVRLVKKQEPQWEFIYGVCTCPPLVPSQKYYTTGGWHIGLGKDNPRDVNIYISYVPTVKEATEWMESMSRWKLGEGWRREKYNLGDEAYLSRNPDKNGGSIYLRKGRIIVELSGDLKDVEQFAKYVEKEMPAS